MALTNGIEHQDYEDEEAIDYTDIEARYAVHHADPLECTILMDGAPVVAPSKRDRLLGALRDFAAKRGVDISLDQVEMPMGQDDKSKGFMFITFPTPALALNAARALSTPFDKKHTLTCIPVSAIHTITEMDDVFQEPAESEEDAFKPRDHLRSWLADPAGRDQLVLVQHENVQVSWCGRGNNGIEVDHERKKWTESYTQWTPFGTGLATLHTQGAALWGGPKFERINRFPHPGVSLIDFSPRERYMVTWSPRPIEVPTDPRAPKVFTEEDEGNHVAVWDVYTGQLLRTFPMLSPPKSQSEVDGVASSQHNAAQRKLVWPMFKWSPDEKYLARVQPGVQISVYETPSMGLVGKKSIKIDGVVDFEWQPMSDLETEKFDEEERTAAGISLSQESAKASAKKLKERENMIAYWLPEHLNQPARVALMTFPSRETIRQKNLFNVADCKLHWQDQGDYLCVKVDRLTKTKKATYCNLELFRVREKAVPIQVVEMKDTVSAFAWEPKGDRFVLITAIETAASLAGVAASMRHNVNFYQLDTRKGDFIATKIFENKTANNIFWSPKGRHVILATLGSSTKYDLEFYDVELDREGKAEAAYLQDPGASVTQLAAFEQYGMTGVEWDPSGRYVAVVGSSWLQSLEAGFALYDFKGAEIQKNVLERFKQLSWRPRPRTLLSRDAQRKIRKNLREYGRGFEEQDALEELNISSELIAQRKRLVEEWNAWRVKSKKELQEEREKLGVKVKAVLDEDQSKEDAEVEEWLEELIEETEEIVD